LIFVKESGEDSSRQKDQIINFEKKLKIILVELSDRYRQSNFLNLEIYFSELTRIVVSIQEVITSPFAILQSDLGRYYLGIQTILQKLEKHIPAQVRNYGHG